MKKIILSLIVLGFISCGSQGTKKSNMEKAQIVEMVLWKSKEGVSTADAKNAIIQLNEFVQQQPGFVSRKTALAEDGKFLDIVLWTDLNAAKTASEKAMKNEKLIPIFSTIDEKEMIFQHFNIFNNLEKN